MIIDLKNVSIKVERKHPHDCIISIGRLNSLEKDALLNMFPTAINSLKSRPTIPSADPLYQMTINVSLSNDEFIIHDSDVCILSIMDRMIISQTEPPDVGFLYERNWFGDVYSNSDSDYSDYDVKVKSVHLTGVAIEVNNKCDDIKHIRIGRISELDKQKLEQLLPSNMLDVRVKTIAASRYYEIDLPASAFGVVDSNNCDISISCDEKKPDSIYITNQNCGKDAFLPPWFLSIATISYEKPDSVCILQQIHTAYDNIHTWFSSEKEETNMTTAMLEKCIINDNVTIMFWSDGTKTVTKTTPGDAFDPEIGIAMGIAKKLFGSKHKFDKYVNAVVSDTYKRYAAAFTERELLDALAENEKITTKAKAKHNAEKAAYVTAKNDPNHDGKLPELHSLKGDRNYRFAKIRKDIIMAEIEKRTTNKATKAKARAKKKKTETKSDYNMI